MKRHNSSDKLTEKKDLKFVGLQEENSKLKLIIEQLQQENKVLREVQKVDVVENSDFSQIVNSLDIFKESKVVQPEKIAILKDVIENDVKGHSYSEYLRYEQSDKKTELKNSVFKIRGLDGVDEKGNIFFNGNYEVTTPRTAQRIKDNQKLIIEKNKQIDFKTLNNYLDSFKGLNGDLYELQHNKIAFAKKDTEFESLYKDFKILAESQEIKVGNINYYKTTCGETPYHIDGERHTNTRIDSLEKAYIQVKTGIRQVGQYGKQDIIGKFPFKVENEEKGIISFEYFQYNKGLYKIVLETNKDFLEKLLYLHLINIRYSFELDSNTNTFIVFDKVEKAFKYDFKYDLILNDKLLINQISGQKEEIQQIVEPLKEQQSIKQDVQTSTDIIDTGDKSVSVDFVHNKSYDIFQQQLKISADFFKLLNSSDKSTNTDPIFMLNLNSSIHLDLNHNGLDIHVAGNFHHQE